MTVAVAKPRRNARRFDKLDIEVATVLAAMKRAEALHLEFARRGRSWRSNRGSRIAEEVAQIVIADVGDALTIDGAWPQT